MIIRVFRAVVHDGKQDEFKKFFLGTALPLVKSQQGLVSVSVGTPNERTPNEFVMVMVWQNLEALRAFSGNKWYEAVIHPDEAHLLKETFLHHYEAAVVG
jgi:heme-degrading monooxygenase HmoA